MTTRLCVSSRSKAFLILVFFSFGVCAQQVDRIEWQENASFSTADKDAIVSLTKTMGIESPRRVSHAQYLPNFCEFVRVESVASEAGHLRTWIELEIHRQDWMKCYKTPRGSKTRHMGRWVASSSDLSTKTEWRIEGNQWHMYLRFEPGVPYADAELVVLAIRHSQLLNRLPTDNSPLKLRPDLPVVDPTDISFMEVCGTEPRTYNVHTGKSKASGEILTVKIKDGKVELHQL